MNARKPVNQSSITYLDELVFKAAPLIVTCSILFILVATLFPFNFSLPDGFSIETILTRFQQTTTHLGDQIKNVLLFLPFGFGLMCLLQKTRLRIITKLIVVLLASFSLTCTVEILQVFLPSREPTFADLVNNTLGGLLGFICFYFLIFKIINYASLLKSKKRLSIKQLILIFLLYIAISFIVPIPLQSATSFCNWDLNYPLLLGNEQTGNRPWQGYISEFYITDQAISKEEVSKVFSDQGSVTEGDSLLAYYQLNGSGDSYPDRTKHLPNLTWRGQPTKAQNEKGVFVSSSHWLETATPVTFLNQRLHKTAEFTIGTTVATANTTQKGPARIISISSNTQERNLTIGQEGSDLIFRLRTPLNGENAQYIRQIVPNIFADTNLHKIVLTYADSVLHVYIDRLQNLHSFNFLEMLPKSDKILYYGLIFITLGSLLGLITPFAQGRLIFYFMLFGGIVLPSLIVEFTLANSSDRSIKLENILLSILIMVGTILVFKWRIPPQPSRRVRY